MTYEEMTRQTNHAWCCVLNGSFEEAISIIADALPIAYKVGSYGTLINAGTAYLLAGHVEDSLRLFQDASGFPLGKVTQNLNVGVALWHLGRGDDACQYWIEEIERRRRKEVTNFRAGGVELTGILCWAAIRISNSTYLDYAIKDIKMIRKKNLKRPLYKHNAWPESIADFILGEKSREEFIKQTDKGSGLENVSKTELNRLMSSPLETEGTSANQNLFSVRSIEAKQLCQCYFHLSGSDRLIGDMVAFVHDLTMSVQIIDQSIVIPPEYLLARNELHTISKAVSGRTENF